MKKLAILGKLETKFKAPFDNPDFDIWGFNYHKIMPPRYTQWFDLHAKNPNPIANITRQNFPFDDCHKLLGGNYFNNTVSYLIAYAVLRGYKEIHLYGMRFFDDGERRKREFQNVRELIFFAKGKGITVKTPYDGIMLVEYPLYGL